jgi:hypothetical protein
MKKEQTWCVQSLYSLEVKNIKYMVIRIIYKKDQSLDDLGLFEYSIMRFRLVISHFFVVYGRSIHIRQEQLLVLRMLML